MPIRYTLVVLLVALLTRSLVAQRPATPPPEGLRENNPTVFALTGAKIIPAPGEQIENATIVIRDGVIVAIGAGVPIPGDAFVRDVTGKTIYAGFIDPLTELPADASRADPALAELMGAGYWNAQVVPQVSAARIYRADAEADKRYRAQGVVARLVAPSYGLVRGTSAVVTTADQRGNRTILRDAVAQHLHLQPARGPERGYPTSPMGALSLVRQALLDADWYAKATQAWADNPSLPRPETNDALAHLARDRAARRLFVVNATDELYALRAIKLAQEFDLRLAIRGSGHEYRLIDHVIAGDAPIIVPLGFPRPPAVNAPELANAASLEDLMHWDLAPENPARLVRAGATIAFTGTGLLPRQTYLAQIRKAVARGLDPTAALAAMTTTPATMLGIDQTHGTLAPGKSASFVITDGELFNDKTKLIETWVDGQRHVHSASPTIDPRGSWIVRSNEQPIARFKVEGEPPRLKGVIEKHDGTTIDAIEDIRIDGQRLSFRLLRRVDDQPQSLIGAVVLLDSDGGSGTAIGFDGATLAITLEPAPPMPATQPTTQPATDEAPDTEPATQASADGDSSTATSPATAPSATGPSTAPATTRARASTTQPASFEPNYPLGEYGRRGLPDQPAVVLFTGATVWTCGPSGKLEKADVLVQNGKITMIAESIDPHPFGESVLIVDGTGKHLTPGIIDCHSHIATDGGINESGQTITAEVRIADFINPADINIYRQLAGGVTGANILHGSANAIGGQNAVVKFRWGGAPDDLLFADAPPGVKFALGENPKQSNWGERFTTRYPQTRMGVEQIIRDAFHAARDYERQWNTYNANPTGIPPRRDLELDALVEIVNQTRLIHCHSYRQDEILALLRLCEEFGIKIASLQHILEGYKVADAMAKHGVGASTFSDWWAFKYEVIDAIPFNASIMFNQGVVVSLNSDDAELARRLNGEAAKVVRYGGVPEEEALKFVTLNAAIQLGIDKHVGSIEPGKDADVVLWSGSPLSGFSRVEQTWIDGRKYFDRADDIKYRAELSRMRQTLIQKIIDSREEPGAPEERERRSTELWPSVDVFCNHAEHQTQR